MLEIWPPGTTRIRLAEPPSSHLLVVSSRLGSWRHTPRGEVWAGEIVGSLRGPMECAWPHPEHCPWLLVSKRLPGTAEIVHGVMAWDKAQLVLSELLADGELVAAQSVAA